jgi:hypothetical protein
MSHPHADLIIAWAEGAEIEAKHDGKWTDLPPDIPPYAPTREYRIKPKQPEWYEDIPEHGVLCWVSDAEKHPDKRCWIRVIDGYRPDDSYPFRHRRVRSWRYATPLTDDEIRQFLRSEK